MNKTKQCSTCKRKRQLKEFSRNISKSLGVSNICKECQRKYTKDWYEKNKRAHIQRCILNKKKMRAERRKWLLEYLKKQRCMDCGESNPIVLDFDHVRGKKRDSVPRLLVEVSLKAAQLEIKKCEVVCANCHRKRTYERGGWTGRI